MTQVLVVGAGPTGLVLALWLARLGARVRIIDKATEPGTTSRAVVVQARTLELYCHVGIDQAVVESGRKAAAVNLWVEGRRRARLVLGDIGAGLSPYPFALVYPQDEHERLLIERLADLGVRVERGSELVDFEEVDDRIHARVKRADGSTETIDCAYLAGCDGAHSTVREALRIGFPGGTYEHLFYVADVQARGGVTNGELHLGLDAADFLVVFPLVGANHARLIGTVRKEAEREHEHLTWNDVSKRVIEWMRLDVEQVNWFSTYHVHHRVADRFRQGRTFIVGDAAHIHSPVGGQGMNTGIGDAVNLAWKLAAVVHGRANADILDTYEPERIAFARRLVATTDQVFTLVTSAGPFARRVRLDVVPWLLPSLFRMPAFRRLMFRTVSQTAVNYRGSRLSEGRAGSVRGGDRLPWVKTVADGVASDNFAALTSLDWQAHVYGDADPALRAMCGSRHITLTVFPWTAEARRAGLRRGAVYLVRPDGYVGLAASVGAAAALASYIDAHGITPVSPDRSAPAPIQDRTGGADAAASR